MDESKTSPAYFFTFFYIDKGHITTRTVYAIREEYKWIFFANEKTPLAIEDTNNYLKRKIKDRINNEIILNYLQKANYNLRDINFYTSSKKTLLFFE